MKAFTQEIPAPSMAKLRLRKATADDVMTYFSWANDPAVRKNSFNTDPIPLEQHKRWFTAKLAAPNTYLYVLELDSKPAGQLRFDVKNGIAEIGFSIDTAFRGMGLGVEILKRSVQALSEEVPLPLTVQGKVKIENNASNRAFLKAGFTEQSANAPGVRCFVLRLS